jgi:hypothetical protein
MTIKFSAILAVALLVTRSSAVHAVDICNAIALYDVPSLDSPNSIIKAGDYDTDITVYQVNKKTGEGSFCSHGGYCYPTHIIKDGARVEALKLTNCKLGNLYASADAEELSYDVEVIRSRVTPTELKIADLANRLLELGVCDACATNIAVLYVKKPASRCSRLTKSALEGNPNALYKLRQSPRYCNAQ